MRYFSAFWRTACSNQINTPALLGTGMTTLTKDLLHELFEHRDGKLFWKVATNPKLRVGNRAGVLRSDGYRQIKLKSKHYLEHRIIWLIHYGELPKFLDHVNNVRDDNRIENLRVATSRQNNQNAKTPSTNTSGVKGVSWHKATKKWHAQIRINGKFTYLGVFTEIAEAKEVVRQARAAAHGEFANHGD